MKPKKPWIVRLGKGVFRDVILHKAETEEKANEFANHYKNVNQRDPILKLLGIFVVNSAEKKNMQ